MPEVHGDQALGDTVRELLGARHPVVAVAVISPRGTRVASVGAEAGADFELGSISKGITGLLYADALARGEVTPSTTVGDLLPVDGTPVAGVALASLTTHQSGLPRLPPSSGSTRRGFALWRHGTNPYGESLDELISQTRAVRLRKPRTRYSNLGFELLGHALARGADTTFEDLVRRRIAEPLSLDGLYVPATPDQLRPGALPGRTKSGRARQPWTGEALGPAGGIRASIGDLARLATALLDGSAPGRAALDPVTKFRGQARIGAGWLTLPHKGRVVTWHNGATGGFRSWLGLDRQARTGVVILSATSASVDHQGFTLLAAEEGR
ncbi:CubicO group peptidase, beta-lactamase class C family [Actinokineospora alba]|uniref:Beta-lactamase n=1 Tax=Actinokineospora alba TaxID=504798 RepID=A0A1H0G4F1_9PSEU|nr:serine hydrolase domain-containing protein [Actinokineospora alba]TDP69756.1 CubicO group peptidase (beta-lactamase class C family) [Actinokineospora alba]SDI09435.1 CubicO group peptidase, beta-lactamase class C family [Actinokineospora alba]SDO01721.1 CubicO group peptidase, beta-lactamase class C family [Actinokineospora alba]